MVCEQSSLESRRNLLVYILLSLVRKFFYLLQMRMSSQKQWSRCSSHCTSCIADHWLCAHLVDHNSDDILRFNSSYCAPLPIAEVLVIIWLENGANWSVSILNSKIDGSVDQLKNEIGFLTVNRKQKSCFCSRLNVHLDS